MLKELDLLDAELRQLETLGNSSGEICGLLQIVRIHVLVLLLMKLLVLLLLWCKASGRSWSRVCRWPVSRALLASSGATVFHRTEFGAHEFVHGHQWTLLILNSRMLGSDGRNLEEN